MKYPLKLNILSKDGAITTKYIFIGNNLDIKKILDVKKIIINKTSAKVLQKYYGSKWKQILSLNTSGGDNESDVNIPDLNDALLPKINELNIPTINNSLPPDLNDINEFDENNEQHVSLNEIYAINDIEQPDVPVVSNELFIRYIFDEIILNSFDNILEFKKKISVLTGIPIYKQNISYKHNNKIYNLNYNIFLQNSVVHVSLLNNIINNESVEFINDIPILINFYNVKNLIKIKAYDTFSIIDNFTTNLGVMEFNLLNLDSFVSKAKLSTILNKNQNEIIYYGFIGIFWPMLSFTAWIDYTTNTPVNFDNIYPDIALNANDKNMFAKEARITGNALVLFNDKNKIKDKKIIEKNMYTSITDTLIQVKTNNYKNIINLRNLFDLLVLNKEIIGCKCSLFYNNTNVILSKTFMDNDKIGAAIPNKCIMLKFADSDWTMLYLYIYTNGNYSIKSKWPEDKLYGFTDIFNIISDIINRVIKVINDMGSNVVQSNYMLDTMTIENSTFSEIYMSLIYRNPIKFYEFKIIENILKEYASAGIINVNNIDNLNVLQYYFRKNMYKFNENRIEGSVMLSNYYNFLTNHIIKNKWNQIFMETRNTTFEYRHGDIKISIEGIKQQEYDIFYMYVINIFDMLETQKKTYVPKKITQFNLQKNIKTLKYQDPLLYDFKRLYKSPIVYSRICQKKNQPIILNDDEYNALNESKKQQVLKYWNFTTKSPAYYQCPNPKYPHVQFTVNKHPKNYCIPCCKIKPIDLNIDDVKQLIYNTCLQSHEYTNSTSVISDIRYIMSYGKYISPGRICHLPEQTVEPLLYESFSDTIGLELKCKNKYYVYGIQQDIKYTRYVGYILVLAFSLDISISALITKTIAFLKQMPHIFKTLLDGNIVKYFKTNEIFIDKIETTFIEDALLSDKKIPWNLIFIDIAYYYFNVISIVFNDLSTQSDENIKLQLTNKINNDNLQDTNYRCLFVIKKSNVYNPIYEVNSVVYFKTKIISKKLFIPGDALLNIITKVNEFNNIDNGKNEITTHILNRFTQHLKTSTGANKYNITKYFVNSHNLCYYVEISTAKIVFYVPVTFSSYTSNSDIVDYDVFKIKKYTTAFAHLNSFIKDYNHWIAGISVQKDITHDLLPLEQTVTPLYSYIMVNKWIYLNNPWASKTSTDADKNIIGFICNGINYYHEALSYNYIKTLNKAPLERILYHPDVINDNLTNQNATIDPRVKNITKNLYDYYLYELLILEYVSLLNTEKNKDVRNLIKKQIMRRNINNSEEIIDKIIIILKEYYAQYEQFRESFDADNNKIIEQINEYAINHKDIKKLLNQIDNTVYNFDSVRINSFKHMLKPDLIAELTKLSKQIVSIESEAFINKTLLNITEFPNMFMPCKNNSSMNYCKQDKLLITNENLTNLLDIMASDILNPFKGKWLFSQLFTDNIITYLKFIHRKNETIEINAY